MRAMNAPEQQLAAWLQRLVALLQAAGGTIARQLVEAVAGRGALVVLDDARLALEAEPGAAGAIELRIAAAKGELPARCATTAATLRDIIDGRKLLDAAVADASLELRAPLPALLAFHELVLMAIVHGPRDADLRALWAEFDANWPRAEKALCAPLAQQAAQHGGLRRFIPEVVRLARSPLADAPGARDLPRNPP